MGLQEGPHIIQHHLRLPPIDGNHHHDAALAGHQPVLTTRGEVDGQECRDATFAASSADNHPRFTRGHDGPLLTAGALLEDRRLGIRHGPREQGGEERPPGVPRRPGEVVAEQVGHHTQHTRRRPLIDDAPVHLLDLLEIRVLDHVADLPRAGLAAHVLLH
jgi:hypothetical protein